MKIPTIQYVKFSSKRHFGVELEMNNHVHAANLVKIVKKVDSKHEVEYSNTYAQDYSPNYWHVKFDRSCGDIKNQGGWEVSSYKAKGYKDVALMGEVAKALKEGGAKVNNECGYHIHVEILDFNLVQLATLVAYWMKIEPVLSEIAPKHRRNHKYCKLLTKKFDFSEKKSYTVSEFWDIVRPKNFGHADRRVALNLCNYVSNTPNRITVELRLPECTLDEKDVKNWARLFIHFVETTKDKPWPEKISPENLFGVLKILGLHGDENNFYLLSAGLRETKIWFAKRIIEHSAKKSLISEADFLLKKLIKTKTTKKMLKIPVSTEIYPWMYESESDYAWA